MCRVSLAFVGLLVGGTARAAESGCEGLAWNLDRERTLLAAASDVEAGAGPPLARRLTMRPLAAVSLPRPPERQPRDAAGALAAVTRVTVPETGLYRVTLDAEGWLDVIQNGSYRHAEAFTGVRACPGLRKSVRFRLNAGEAVIQVTGMVTPIGLALTREP